MSVGWKSAATSDVFFRNRSAGSRCALPAYVKNCNAICSFFVNKIIYPIINIKLHNTVIPA